MQERVEFRSIEALLVCGFLFVVTPDPLQSGQRNGKLFLNDIPQSFQENPSSARMIGAQLEARALLGPDLVYPNIRYLELRYLSGMTDPQSNGLDFLNGLIRKTRDSQARWIDQLASQFPSFAEGERIISQLLDRKSANPDSPDGMVMHSDPPYAIDENRADYFFLKWHLGDEAMSMNPAEDYHALRIAFETERRSQMQTKSLNGEDLGSLSEAMDEVFAFWTILAQPHDPVDRGVDTDIPVGLLRAAVEREYASSRFSRFGFEFIVSPLYGYKGLAPEIRIPALGTSVPSENGPTNRTHAGFMVETRFIFKEVLSPLAYLRCRAGATWGLRTETYHLSSGFSRDEWVGGARYVLDADMPQNELKISMDQSYLLFLSTPVVVPNSSLWVEIGVGFYKEVLSYEHTYSGRWSQDTWYPLLTGGYYNVHSSGRIGPSNTAISSSNLLVQPTLGVLYRVGRFLIAEAAGSPKGFLLGAILTW